MIDFIFSSSGNHQFANRFFFAKGEMFRIVLNFTNFLLNQSFFLSLHFIFWHYLPQVPRSFCVLISFTFSVFFPSFCPQLHKINFHQFRLSKILFLKFSQVAIVFALMTFSSLLPQKSFVD